jgi:acetylornithine deacetylase/succinyl-diaminopimelate desuccinylase-like protein
VAAVAKWQPAVRLNETTSAYFKRLAEISPPAEAQRYRDVLDPRKIEQVDAYFRKNEPRHASMLRTSVSPNMVVAGYRINVIPSEAVATLDVRALPDEDMKAFLEKVRKVVDDPNVEVRFGKRDTRPGGTEARIDSEMFKSLESAARTHYNAPTLPTMSTAPRIWRTFVAKACSATASDRRPTLRTARKGLARTAIRNGFWNPN